MTSPTVTARYAPSYAGTQHRIPRQVGPVRLTLRGRVLLLAALVVVLFVAFSSLRLATQAGTTPTGPATRTLTVHSGETLWQIAKQVAPADDPRDTVDRIRDLNALDTAVVRAGQLLIVPT